MRRFLPMLATLAPLLLAGCPLLSAAVEIPEVCVTYHDRTITGRSPGTAFRHSLLFDATASLSPFLQLGGEITSARATLRAHHEVVGLAFLEGIRVSLRGVEPGAARPPITLVRCADYACATANHTTSLASDVQEDIMGYLGTGEVQLDVTLTGPLPEHDWTVDVEVCLSGHATVALVL
jgi:hypothetical protein